MRAIAYASHSLHPAEKNYSSMKLEFLVMKWAMVERFKEYLWGQQYIVWTDNNTLSHLDSAKAKILEQMLPGTALPPSIWGGGAAGGISTWPCRQMSLLSHNGLLLNSKHSKRTMQLLGPSNNFGMTSGC